MAEPKNPKAVDRRVIDARTDPPTITEGDPDITAEASATETVSEKPPMARLFEAIGIVEGGKFQTVSLSNGGGLGHVEVKRIYVVREENGVPGDVVIAFGEDGTRNQTVVRWCEIVSLHKRG